MTSYLGRGLHCLSSVHYTILTATARGDCSYGLARTSSPSSPESLWYRTVQRTAVYEVAFCYRLCTCTSIAQRMTPHPVPRLEISGRRVLIRKAGDMLRVHMYPSRLKSVRLCQDEREQYIEAACSLLRLMEPVVRQRQSCRLYFRQSNRSKVKALMMKSEVMSLAGSQIHQSTIVVSGATHG